jgi:hypothetical protein
MMTAMQTPQTPQTAPALEALGTLQAALAQVRTQQLTPHAFSTQARAQTALLAGLPPQFETVLLNLLDRLESSALFSDESCSFSQTDLLDSLQMWADKAAARLALVRS